MYPFTQMFLNLWSQTNPMQPNKPIQCTNIFQYSVTEELSLQAGFSQFNLYPRFFNSNPHSRCSKPPFSSPPSSIFTIDLQKKSTKHQACFPLHPDFFHPFPPPFSAFPTFPTVTPWRRWCQVARARHPLGPRRRRRRGPKSPSSSLARAGFRIGSGKSSPEISGNHGFLPSVFTILWDFLIFQKLSL